MVTQTQVCLPFAENYMQTKARTSETVPHHLCGASHYSHFRTCPPFCDNISNGSRVIVLTDKQTPRPTRTLLKTIAPLLRGS